MFLPGIRHKQKAGAFLSLILIVLCVALGFSLFAAEGLAASAMRSRVYGFRHTDNKEAMQLVGKLGFKVTIDAHSSSSSSSVVVLTGDDADELTRAYTVMVIADQKEPVVLKVLGVVPDDKAESVIDALHSQFKTMNIGTLLNPPAKSVAEPLVVDVYQGELIVLAAESQIGKIEAAYKTLQGRKPLSRPAASEPNVPVPTPAISPVPVEPNTKETPAVEVKVTAAIEPNAAELLPKPKLQQAAPAVAEPNKPVLQETPVMQPAADSVQPRAAEPNEVKPQESQTQEDFISNELLKTLDAEEKKVEAKKAADAPQPAAKTEEVSEPAKEITADEFKNIVAQLMKQASEEEKKAAVAPAAAADSNQPVPPAPVKEPAIKKETPKPVAAQSEPIAKKVETTKKDSRVKTVKAPSDPNTKAKAADAKASVSKEEEELELTIALPEKVDIKQLIELVGKQLGLNYMYDETKIKGEVTLKVHDGKIKVKDCYTLLETVLRYKGFVMTRRGNLVTILPNAELNFSDPKFRTSDEPIEAGDVFINSIVTFKHARYANVQNMLRLLNLGTNIIPIPESNSLIITDYAYRMDKIEQVIAILDVPGVPKTYAHRSLKYMQASEIIPRLQTLAVQMENLSITAGTSAPSGPSAAPARIDPRTGQPMPGGMPQPAIPQSAAPQEQTVYLDADQRTNRVLMVGNEEQLKTVNELIDSLDVRQYNLRFVKEYPIKNVDASEVINVLNELGLATVATPTSTSQPTRTTAQPTRPGQQPPRPGTPQPPQQQAASAQGSTTPDEPSISIRPNTNSLLVNATSEQHEDIELVIKHIDVEQTDQRTIEEYEIQNVDAKEIVQTLGDLSIISKDSVSNITSSKSSMYDSQMSSRSGRSSSRFGNPQQPYQQPGMPGQEGMPETSNVVSLPMAEGGTVRELITTEPQISILETTNALLIYATPRQHASVALVIAHVDRELSETTAPYVVYPLENQDPEELADTLTSLIEGTVKRATTSGGTQPPGAGPMAGDNRIRTEQTESVLPKKDEERITIIPDAKSYSLIVYANKKNQQWIATLIKQLDQYRPQVLLDCTLVSITRDDEFKFDLDVISKKGGLGSSMTRLPNPILPGASPATTVTPITGYDLEGTVSFGSGSVFYGDSHIQALLELTDKKSYGRVLGRPSILVKDNEEGVIKAEYIKYVAEYSSDTVTPDQGSAQISQNVTFKDYPTGITLTITPHIASEKLMQLEIELDRKDLDPADSSGGVVSVKGEDYPKPLDTVSSNIKTWSIVPSGATIILGGIEGSNQIKGVDKVPVLGDIPLIGLLFRGVSQTDNQTKLYIFVKANIIQSGAELTGQSDIERISQKKRRAFEEDEANFQLMQALPGPKPNPMAPKKILEDDEYIQKLKEQQDQGNVITVPLN